jgi:hypothetical protein
MGYAASGFINHANSVKTTLFFLVRDAKFVQTWDAGVRYMNKTDVKCDSLVIERQAICIDSDECNLSLLHTLHNPTTLTHAID